MCAPGIRALDYFQAADAPWDERMADALVGY